MIPRNSTSYPYLAIAQHTGADYGQVLALVEYIESSFKTPYPLLLPPVVHLEIALAVDREHHRRARIICGASR